MIPNFNTFRDIRRVADILSVLIRYGFEDVLRSIGLDKVVGSKLFWLAPRLRNQAQRYQPVPTRLREAMEELGPTFIKLGQVLSTRPDLIPQAWVDEFKKLQDDCPKVPFDVIQKRLDEEFQDRTGELFRSIDPEPLAAASIGQTHRAVLADGTDVVLKVLRPGIEETIRADMEVLAALASFVETHFTNLGYSPTAVVEEFALELQQELDLMHEARATDRLRKAFEATPKVTFPEVYWNATTKNVLTIEEIHGTLLSRVHLEELDEDYRREIVALGADAVFRQCFELHFFHADPHPGNLFLTPDGGIAFIDCGMTGHLDPKMADHLADVFYGVVSDDIDRIIGAILGLSEVDPVVTESNAFRADISEYVSQFQGVALGQLDIGGLLQEFFEKLQKYHVRCPSSIVFLIKAVVTIEGVATEIAPHFDLMEHAQPYLEKLVKRRYSFGAIRRRIQTGMLNTAELAEHLPGDLSSLMTQFRRRQFQINLQHEGLHDLNVSLTSTGLAMSKATIFAALLIGSAILIHAECVSPHGGKLMGLGLFGIVCSGILAAQTFLSFRIRHRRSL